MGDDVIALGEEKMHGEIDAALRAGKVADGHFCWPPDDWRLAAYAASGITGCHEGTTEDTVWRVRQGMYAKLRRGSAWHDVAATVKAHTELGLDPRHIVLVTDDRSPESLVEEVAERSRAIGEALLGAGCRLNYAFMTLSLLALVMLPELHVSDKGLVGVGEKGFAFVDPFEEG